MNNLRSLLKNLTYLFLGLILTPSSSFAMGEEDTSAGNYFDNMIDYWESQQPQSKKEEAPKDGIVFLGYGSFIESVAQEVADDNPVSRVALILKTEKQRRALPNWMAEAMGIAATAAANALYQKLVREDEMQTAAIAAENARSQ